ncbi:MAG: acyl carrier protein [Deltaproteobacteria bacterium]|nr:acyl carrier protein [Deltaproteobacteria bacterium]
MHTDDQIIELFRAAVKEVDGKDLGAITRETEISDLGLDSVMTMEVIGVLEEKLDMRFPDEDLATLKRIGDLTTLVRKMAA